MNDQHTEKTTKPIALFADAMVPGLPVQGKIAYHLVELQHYSLALTRGEISEVFKTSEI
jgi:hypothetical protein